MRYRVKLLFVMFSRAFKQGLACVAFFAVGGFMFGNAYAIEISVLSAGAVEPGMLKFASHIERTSGHKLKIIFNTAPQIAERLAAGEAFDMLISPTAVIDRAIKEGKAVVDDRVLVGRVGVGVAVKSGARTPDISSVDTLKKEIQRADRIIYNKASTGQYMDKLLRSMGLIDSVTDKVVRYANGEGVMEHIIKGDGNEMAFGALTEIKAHESQGVKLVGPLPSSIQNWTTYEAVQMSSGKAAAVVKDILMELRSERGRAMLVEAGIE